ncbi:uncharacterized protein LOC123270836 [Cotesia glomerata]|uniref:Uncharacterized protein n=1 Tax=Cotesia glomerata TaxID=32391 RepID=A0AAV7IHM5_COTGL|nr:uncharacterized protein LOC123270836 [Cotesia glomerata]KAH0552017.1 hypothetical protein KQX54_004172 [Cotesia glomerata]
MIVAYKLVLVGSLLVAVAPVIKSETKGLIELKNVRVGAIVNRLQRNESTIEVHGSIFKSNTTYPEIYRNFTEFIRYPPSWRSRQFDCIESIHLVSHPSVIADNKFTSNNAIDRSFLQLEENLLEREKLNIDDKFKNSNYTCVLYEICNLKEERIKKNVKVFDEDDLPVDTNTITYVSNQNAVFMVKKGIETDYVASITKGTCLAQVYAYEKDSIKEQLFSSYADKIIAFKSPLVSATNNTKLENWMEDFLNKTQSSLFNFENFSVQNQSKIFKRMESDAIRDFRLVNLPTLSDKLIKFPPTKKQLQQLKPGYTLNIRELKNDTVSVISIMNLKLHEETFSGSDKNFAMTIRTRNNDEKIKSSCPFERLAVRSSDYVNDHQDLEFFNCLVEKQLFGVSEYLKKEFKRMEVRVCRTVKKELLEEPLSIINWHKDFEDIGYNVFIDENIAIRYPKEGETHYVSAVHKGDCLYQAFVYKASDNIDTSLPLFNSELISGSGDIKFINKIRELLLNTDTPKHGLYQVIKNETLNSEVKKQFGDDYVLSVNLRPMRTARPPPQLNLIEHYFNFGNSLQASLVTILIIMIAAKLFIN